jgi:3-methyladenine DNA glycosylase AlkD
MTYQQVIARLEGLANPNSVEGMARFGIVGSKILGISIRDLRKLAKKIGRNHQLASDF